MVHVIGIWVILIIIIVIHGNLCDSSWNCHLPDHPTQLKWKFREVDKASNDTSGSESCKKFAQGVGGCNIGSVSEFESQSS